MEEREREKHINIDVDVDDNRGGGLDDSVLNVKIKPSAGHNSQPSCGIKLYCALFHARSFSITKHNRRYKTQTAEEREKKDPRKKFKDTKESFHGLESSDRVQVYFCHTAIVRII